MMSSRQLRHDTVELKEQKIILQQLQAVIKKTILTPLMQLMILHTCVTITQNKCPIICPSTCVVPVA